MTNLKTDESLLEALRSAAQRRPSADEVQRQRVSFILSAVNQGEGVTKSRIQEVLSEQDGSGNR